ncbi:MAG: sugar phosphate isomerase/epimerase [Calditrichaeota bacterium]|nr:MAG: sugar phosphate isomerase/epimerase [Calditrichota bacterium]
MKTSIEPIADLSRLCIHSITNKPWSIELMAEKYARAGVSGITIWREALADRDPAQIRRRFQQHGISIVSLCRGGFFASADHEVRQRAIQDNLLAIDMAVTLETDLIVLVCGADPVQSLEKSRMQIMIGLETILPHAETYGIRLAVEPLHPMYADVRSAINTLRQANDLVETIGSPLVGVAVDVYHLWWDPDLEDQIHRCGELDALFAFHLSDWKTPTTDLLNDRGLMGEGCIPLRTIRGWVEETGFTGHHEIEIFSNHYWQMNQDEYLNRIISAYRENC